MMIMVSFIVFATLVVTLTSYNCGKLLYLLRILSREPHLKVLSGFAFEKILEGLQGSHMFTGKP